MKKVWFVVLIVVFSVSWAWAQSRPFETLDQARQRHSAERYETFKDHGYQAPLGGYPERLGDPAPHGTESPGLVSPGQGRSSLYDPSPGYGRHGLGSLDDD